MICLTEQRRAYLQRIRGLDLRKDRSFETLLVTIVYFEITHVCRIWELPYPVGFSIPTLARLIDSSDVLAIVEAENAAALKALPEDKRRFASDNIARLKEAIRTADTIAGSAQFERIQNLRNKEAHAILWTSREKVGHVEIPQRSDTDWIVDRTVELMSTVSSVARPTDYDFLGTAQLERETAKRFFDVLGPALRLASGSSSPA